MDEKSVFIPGLELSEAFYWEAVRPILLRHFPTLPHSAALIGYGSDVISCDTPMSRDHMWGPRMVLFLPPCDFEPNRVALDNALRHELPFSFRGYSTHFGPPDHEGTRLFEDKGKDDEGPVDHLIEIYTIEDYFERELGLDPYQEFEPVDWLTFQEHRLLTLTAGKVFHDDLGLDSLRSRFAYYPQDVWLYLLAAQWMLISQEEPFMGRTGDNGDELGSRIIAARLVEKIIRLCFLVEKRYAPYSKWLGTLFRRLECSRQMSPILDEVLKGNHWREREKNLSQAYLMAIRMHNSLGITPSFPEEVTSFHNRPFQVVHGEKFSEAIQATIKDKEVRALPPFYGSVNQYLVESSNVLQSVETTRKAKELY